MTRTTRILYLEDDCGDARLFEMMLVQARADEFEVTHAERLSTALEHLSNGPFDLIVADLTVPDSRGLSTFTQLQAQAQGSPIVVMTRLDDESAAIKAVQQGAQDFLVKGQVTGTTVVRSLRLAIERHRQLVEHGGNSGRPAGRVLAFLGARGGVGTTTVALNIAAGLTVLEKQVNIVELRPYFGTLALQLGQRPVDNLKLVLDLEAHLIDERELDRRLLTTHFGLRVLCSPQKPAAFGEIDPDRAGALIATLAGMADYAVVDLPCQPSVASQVVARLAHHLIMIIDCEPIGLACGRVLRDVIGAWEVPPRRVGAIVVDRSADGPSPRLPEIRSRVGCELIGVLPPAADDCRICEQTGDPLILSHSHYPIAATMAEIVTRLAADPIAPMKLDALELQLSSF